VYALADFQDIIVAVKTQPVSVTGQDQKKVQQKLIRAQCLTETTRKKPMGNKTEPSFDTPHP